MSDDGQAIVLARFESAAAAQANSERPEQGEWWTETERCFDGDVTFTDSEDVDTFLAGGSDDAGFVQVMKDRCVDRDRLGALDDAFADHAGSFRPDSSVASGSGPNPTHTSSYMTLQGRSVALLESRRATTAPTSAPNRTWSAT